MDFPIFIVAGCILVIAGTASGIAAARRRHDLIEERKDALRGKIEDSGINE